MVEMIFNNDYRIAITMKDPLTINSIVKAFQVLECFSGNKFKFTLTELVNQLHISMGAAQRITHTLTSIGYLYKDPETKAFRLTPKCLSFGFAFLNNSGLREIALPYLKKLNEEINETVNLAVMDDYEIVYIERVQTSHFLTTNIRVGTRRPVFCTSIGKVILAFSPKNERKEALDRISFKKYTEKTITDNSKLEIELNKIRRLGYAENKSELDEDLFALAVPLLNNEGAAVAGINIVIPMTRVSMSKVYGEYLPLLVEKGEIISSLLGNMSGKA